MNFSERFAWAVQLLDPQPGDHILEIGCGAGIFIEHIGRRLQQGSITAVDRSASMISKAGSRNRHLVESGKLQLLCSPISEVKNMTTTFDKVAAFNVNFFLKGPSQELQLIRGLMKPDGHLCIFHQAPYEIDETAAEPICSALEKNGFRLVKLELKPLKPFAAIGTVFRLQ